MEHYNKNVCDITYMSELSRQLQENLCRFAPKIFEAFCCRDKFAPSKKKNKGETTYVANKLTKAP